MSKKRKPAAKPERGPKPEVLEIEGDWKDAIKHALDRGKPPAKRATTKRENNT